MLTINLDPMHDPALYNLGCVYKMIGQIDLAIRSFRLSVKLQPNNPECHFALAITLRENNQLEGAKLHFKKVLEIEHNEEAYNQLAEI